MIQDYIKRKIKNGEWPAGSNLPSQRELASTLGVNRSTIIAALDELKAQGLIEGKMGSSTKVVQNLWQQLTNSTPHWNDFVQWSLHPPNDPIVRKINQTEIDRGFIHLSKGELGSDLYPRKELSQTFKKVGENISYYGYGDGKGSLSLRRALSHHLASRGVLADPESILIVSGSLQALQLISLGVLQSESTVFLEKPSYLYSTHVFRSMGMKLKGIPVNDKGLDTAYFRRQSIVKNKSIVYTNPTFHNPTGNTMPLERRKELLRVCEEYQLPLIEDDIYRDLWLEEEPPSTLKSLDTQGHVLYTGSFSKTIDPGLRIGWMVGPEKVIGRLADIRMQIDYGTSMVSQAVAEYMLTSGLYELHLQQTRKELLKKRNYLIQLLNRYFQDDAYWEVPKGGFFILVHFKHPINTKHLFSESFKKKVLINPTSIYQDITSQSIRLSFAYPTYKQMQQGIEILKGIIESR
ncbi:HTH-type transcriptional regulator NorG [Paraliobacillus sp. PM-2]|uniref:aminotransferase-like domain-containing protein n=1 Tax=Paraliobacillus sp. PM-2 TaxID=1462524 RepID=UPI00061BEA95|nr:PLP-dependent aminotransferase family protein [Paraliobacillus sp. PM-2]CQR46615.1 HTH-type transcriptional regulator NorG [Paraliobacillus sp. PM-2]